MKPWEKGEPGEKKGGARCAKCGMKMAVGDKKCAKCGAKAGHGAIGAIAKKGY